MPDEKNKWIDAVGKLIALTQQRKLIWRASGSKTVEADHAGKTLRLSSDYEDGMTFSNLKLVEPQTGVVWEFPYSAANEDLMQAARYRLVGVGDFLDELLSKTANIDTLAFC